MNIRISADSTCDLSSELVEQYHIAVIPLRVVMDGKPLRDGVDIKPNDLFAHVAAGGTLCHTVAVNLSEYVDFFGSLLETADAVVHFCISSDMSSCFQNARLAATQLDNVWVIDSRSLSTGIGHLVLDAARLAEEGMPPEEIAAEVERRREKLDVSFVLDTLEYLKKGGRCSAIAAFGANLLNIKPAIQVKNGKMGICQKYRGSLEKTLEKYVAERLAEPETVDPQRIFITHSGVSKGILDFTEHAVLEQVPFAEVLRTSAGCTISSHCGPNCLGILFYRR